MADIHLWVNFQKHQELLSKFPNLKKWFDNLNQTEKNLKTGLQQAGF